MPFFTHEETQFRYYDEGEGLPCVFLHGLGSNLLQPVSYLEALPGIRLISMDFRGHGQTSYEGPPAAYQIPVFAADVMALLDHLGIREAVLGGISLGAAVALHLAIRFRERVKALILVRPAWLNQPYPVHLDLLVRIGRWVELRGVEEARIRLLQDDNFQEIRSRLAPAAESILGQLRRPHVANAYEALMRLPASVPFLHWEELEDLDIPALVIINSHDPLHPLVCGRQLATALVKGELQQVAPRYLDPDRHRKEVRRHLMRFLQMLPAL